MPTPSRLKPHQDWIDDWIRAGWDAAEIARALDTGMSLVHVRQFVRWRRAAGVVPEGDRVVPPSGVRTPNRTVLETRRDWIDDRIRDGWRPTEIVRALAAEGFPRARSATLNFIAGRRRAGVAPVGPRVEPPAAFRVGSRLEEVRDRIDEGIRMGWSSAEIARSLGGGRATSAANVRAYMARRRRAGIVPVGERVEPPPAVRSRRPGRPRTGADLPS